MAITAKIEGLVLLIEEVEEGTNRSGKDWRAQSLVVEAGDEKYPNPLKVTFWNNGVSELALVGAGDEVVVEAYLRGREWNDKYSVKLNGKSLTVTKKNSNPVKDDEGEADEPIADEDFGDDMPF